MVAMDGIESTRRAGNRPSKSLLGPKGCVQQFLDVMLRFIEIHCDFLFDDPAFSGDLLWSERRVQEHIHENLEQLIKVFVPCPCMKTGCFFGGECVEITT